MKRINHGRTETPRRTRLESLSVPLCFCGFLFLSNCGQTTPVRTPDASATTLTPVPPPARTFEPVIEPWTFEDQEGQIITTPNFRLLTTVTSKNSWASADYMTRRYPILMERAIDHYITSITKLPPPAQRLETYVMANRPQWSRVTQRLMRDEAEVYLRIPRGGFTANGRSILYFIGRADTLAIAAHEGWHQYTQTTFQNPLPVWLEEGLACYMEGFGWNRDGSGTPTFNAWKNAERFDALARAYRENRLQPLDALFRYAPQDFMKDNVEGALTYYAQAWAFVHFLNEGSGGKYRESLREILQDAANGQLVPRIQASRGSRAAGVFVTQRRGADLVLVYVTRNLELLSAEYEAFVADITRLGKRDRIIAGETPVTP